MRRRLSISTLVVLCTVAFAVGLVVVRGGGSSAQAETLTSRVRDTLEQDYYRELPSAVLAQATVPGMIAALHDPYTEYLDPGSYRLIRAAVAGRYSGVGLTLLPVGRGLAVVAVEDGPARRAGVRVGDVVVAVDGVRAAGLGYDASLGRIIGPPGTPVTLLVRHGSVVRTVPLVRRLLVEPDVRSRLLATPRGPVAYVRLSSFRSGVAPAAALALRRLERRGARAIVLDLRGNPGGLLSQAVAVSSLFLQRGTIVTIEGAHLPRVVYRARGGGVGWKPPLAVLVDGGSASAAEVVAAALRDNDRAVLVGERTFGKGLVQSLRPLPNGGALKLTTGRYLTPVGIDISGVGVRPDIVARDDAATARDETLVAALHALGRR